MPFYSSVKVFNFYLSLLRPKKDGSTMIKSLPVPCIFANLFLLIIQMVYDKIIKQWI